MDSDLVKELKAIIAEKHMLDHPFYQAWTKGTMPIEVLKGYSEQYFHLENQFPHFLSRAHVNSDKFDVRQEITENLYDEEFGPENHRELWLRFGEGVGADRDGMVNSERLPETQAAIDAFNGASDSSDIEGVAALSAYESQLPDVSVSKVKGLKDHYNIDDERTTKFFDVHGIVDVEHADAWWRILDKYTTDENKQQVVDAVRAGRDALWGFLDGVCREYFPEVLEEQVA